MRQIKIISIIFYLMSFLSPLAHSAKTSIQVRNRATVPTSQALNVEQNVRGEMTYGMDLNYEHTGVKSFGGIVPSVGLSVNRADYSNYKIRGKDKVERTLTSHDNPKPIDEYMLSTNFAYAKGEHGANLSMYSHLENYFFKRRGVSANYDYTFNERSSTLGVKGIYFWQDKPFAYYLDGAKLKPGSTYIQGQKVSLYYQQIWPFDTKTKWEVFSGQRRHERPRHFGTSVKAWKALSDSLFVRLEGTYSEEIKTNFRSYDGRGHFRLLGSSAQLTYEPIIGLLLSGMYGLSVERETNLATNTFLQTGLDQFGLGLSITSKANVYNLVWNSLKLSNGKEQSSFSGGISWDM